ncbi:MAG TPA: S8 family serine peptidase, partial [Pyrinomonadaceae bacterium]|nr:S8 family serine peptidase [Pyrinomonadaceae bacterium]
MKRIKRSRFITWVALAALLLAGSSGMMMTQSAQAQSLLQPGDKMSSDLKGASGSKVNVIIQPNGAWSSGLSTAIKSNNGMVKKQFTNIKARVVELPPAAVEALASRSDVQYVSLDRSVKSMGHVSLTTGADAVRSAVPGTTLDGTGIGIAILDSGIDPNHASFKGSNGSSRIVFNQDFTGEGRTSDPYGHGTHVAGAAAGNGDVAQGAYIGIAPNANLINLRVLGAQGNGTTSGLLSAIDWVLSNKANYNIRIVNMSLGTAAVDSYKNDPLCQAVRRMVDAGIVVAAAAGN